ncbi:L,D-transpeptidase [Hydrogenophaga sp. XSHU_21]
MAFIGPHRPDSHGDSLAAVRRGLLAGLAGLLLAVEPPGWTTGWGVAARPDAPASTAQVADFGSTTPSPAARALANNVARVRDHQGLPFFVIDKATATLHVFDGDSRLQASSPVLLGSAPGDDSVPGIGSRPIGLIQPEERTTPAGRFVAEAGRNLQGEDIVWVDHHAAISMHRVRTAKPLERRAERLATPTTDDNRISYGCINVPVDFYDAHVRTVFAASRTAIVYITPQTRPLKEQFAWMEVPTDRVAHTP